MMYFFVRYVKELGAISIEQAVHKATGRPASHYKLDRRGMLLEGYFADINVFDLQQLKINATFAEPCHYCSGMDHVIVNGQIVIEKGKHTGIRPGRALRRQQIR